MEIVPLAVDEIEARVARIEDALALRKPSALVKPMIAPASGTPAALDGASETAAKRNDADVEVQLAEIAARLDNIATTLDDARQDRDSLIDANNRQLAQIGQIQQMLAETQTQVARGLRDNQIISSKLDFVRNAHSAQLASRALASISRRLPRLSLRLVRRRAGHLEARHAKLIRESGLFDDKFYRAQHLSVVGTLLEPDVDTAVHFLQHGHGRRLNPHPDFDVEAYNHQYPDVEAAGENALLHYLIWGRAEGRSKWPSGNVREIENVLDPPDAVSDIEQNCDIPAVVSQISFPRHDTPEVSIIIPCYNKVKFTLSCLLSIYHSLPNTPFEVIIADDASSESEVAPLSWIENLRVIRQIENLGFLRNCNAAAKTARGRYLYFLNNDVIVQDGWLDALVNVFENAADGDRVGVVGSKLLFPDGMLQEAGGIIWRDGSGWNVGRGTAPDAPEFNYLREVDYCSGASIMVSRELWDTVGGFDERFAPAYYEDTDLAFAARQAGFKVYYCPQSVVTHLEGVSSGTDLSTGVKRHQAENQPKFVEKWQRELAQQLPPGQSPSLARERGHLANIMVMVDHHVPKFDSNAGDLAVWEYLLLLRDMGFNVKYFPNNGYLTPGYSEKLQAAGIEVVGFVEPRNIFDEWVKENGAHVSWFWLARPEVATDYIDSIRQHSPGRIAYFTHDLHFMRRAQELGADWRPPHADLDLNRLYSMETSVMREADVVLSVSDDETQVIKSLVPDADVRTVPLRLFPDDAFADLPKPFDGRRGLLFLGGFGHPPNLDAMTWFAEEIFPLIRKRRPDITLSIAGSEAPPEILQLDQRDGIEVHGFVEDLDPLFEAARYFICPLRVGAGMKGKIVTSLGYGLPVITTSIGNQGLDMENEVGIPVCDTAAAFADTVIDLYDNETAWTSYSAKSQALARRRFGKSGATDILSDVFDIAVPTCHICGDNVVFIPPDPKGNLREEIICKPCGTSFRSNHLASTLLAEIGKRTEGEVPPSLSAAVSACRDLSFLEISGNGAVYRALSRHPNHIRTAFFDDVEPGETGSRGIRCEDVEALTFEDACFDVVISEDVFEHVSRPMEGFSEVYRVLKPGGVHVFTIPYYRDQPKTVARATRTRNGVRHHAAPEYHGGLFGSEGQLVFTDFGRDLPDKLRSIGFEVGIYATHAPRFANSWNEVFVTRKPLNAAT